MFGKMFRKSSRSKNHPVYHNRRFDQDVSGSIAVPSLEELRRDLMELKEMGFIEIVGHNEKGEELFAITELGRLELEVRRPNW